MALEHRLIEQATALAALLEGELGARSDDELRTVLSRLGEVRRLLDGVAVRVAGEVAHRCEEGTLAVRWGERSVASIVSSETGVDPAEATAWCALGRAIRPRVTLTGAPLAPHRPELATALDAADLGAAALARIATTADELDRRAVGYGGALIPVLIAEAPHLGPRQLARLCRHAIDRADPDGVEPREEELRRRAGLQVLRLPDGMVRWVVTMDPESAGLLTAAVDARTAPRREPRFRDDAGGLGGPSDTDDAGGGPGDPATRDDRTLAQRRLDALVGVARAALRADDGEVSGTAVTMVVTVPLATLQSGFGAAWIEGVEAPICAGTARRLAAEAEIIPLVLGGGSEPLDLGGGSEPLDLGRSARLFSRAQRRALAARDGGCVWPDCTAPPGWCEAAHVEPWARGGPTDLDNAILLCPFHHRRFDLDGWTLEVRGGERWLVPPPWIDARRRPRRIGRTREAVAA